MFTGIIQITGHISEIEPKGSDSRFIFNVGNMNLSDINIGESIAVNGACLTIVSIDGNEFTADLSKETLELTTFSALNKGSRINLEKAMQLSDRLNGHMVSGHIDGVGEITEKKDEGRSVCYSIKVPHALLKYISKKGSLTVDGVSLTVNDVYEDIVSINIIPHTLSETIISDYEIGTQVNLEVDLIARYLDQLIKKD